MTLRTTTQLAALAIACAALAAAVAQTGSASTSTGLTHGIRAQAASSVEVSSNWSGYAAISPTATPISYTNVTGTWVAPSVTCTPADAGAASSVWVGIGGYSYTSPALEQAGTSADCDNDGKPSYYAWYELIPDVSHTIKAKVLPGDTITTSVVIVDANNVLLQVKNRTRHWTFNKKLAASVLDVTSAEWIAEAPSECTGRCHALPLANFGAVTISKIAATGDGAPGTLSNPAWSVLPIQLVPHSSTSFYAGPETRGSLSSSTAGALPATFTPDGRSFGVSWLANSTAS